MRSFNLRSVRDISDLGNKRVLLRLDLNEPVINGKVADDMRIERALPTIDLLRKAGARIIIVSHRESAEDSLQPMVAYLARCGVPARFIAEGPESWSAHAAALNPGEVLLLENLRAYPGEVANDPKFAEQLASLADVYVNEAFSVSHRAHASIVGVPAYIPAYAGLRFIEEVTELSAVFSPQRPFFVILGGAKFATKEPLLQKLITQADAVFVGGALANDFLKARGLPVGRSLVSKTLPPLALVTSNDLLVPCDVVVETAGKTKRVVHARLVGADDRIVDAGPQTIDILVRQSHHAGMVLWNGPLGTYEEGYDEVTLELAKALAGSAAKTVVGGGDTLAAIRSLGLESKFSFMSTGGGAMLVFLAEETLVGIEALQASR